MKFERNTSDNSGAHKQKANAEPIGIPARELPLPNFSAFFATLANNTGPLTQDKDIAFTNVITNHGNDYDPQTGVYTVPYSGTYQFLITISATGRQKVFNRFKNKYFYLISIKLFFFV